MKLKPKNLTRTQNQQNFFKQQIDIVQDSLSSEQILNSKNKIIQQDKQKNSLMYIQDDDQEVQQVEQVQKIQQIQQIEQQIQQIQMKPKDEQPSNIFLVLYLTQRKNLSFYSLYHLVQLCSSLSLLPPSIYNFYLTKSSIPTQIRFLSRLFNNKLQKEDFYETRICLIDHRRLTGMIMSQDMGFTFQGLPYDGLAKARQLLATIYSLTKTQYLQIINSYEQHYNLFWWRPSNQLQHSRYHVQRDFKLNINYLNTSNIVKIDPRNQVSNKATIKKQLMNVDMQNKQNSKGNNQRQKPSPTALILPQKIQYPSSNLLTPLKPEDQLVIQMQPIQITNQNQVRITNQNQVIQYQQDQQQQHQYLKNHNQINQSNQNIYNLVNSLCQDQDQNRTCFIIQEQLANHIDLLYDCQSQDRQSFNSFNINQSQNKQSFNSFNINQVDEQTNKDNSINTKQHQSPNYASETTGRLLNNKNNKKLQTPRFNIQVQATIKNQTAKTINFNPPLKLSKEKIKQLLLKARRK